VFCWLLRPPRRPASLEGGAAVNLCGYLSGPGNPTGGGSGGDLCPPAGLEAGGGGGKKGRRRVWRCQTHLKTRRVWTARGPTTLIYTQAKAERSHLITLIFYTPY
jgi:hypothetical protein